MNSADELAFWYELRDRLRSDFIHCMENERPFPQARQRMLDRAEDVVARAERLKRAAQPKEPSTLDSSTTNYPHPTVTPREEIH